VQQCKPADTPTLLTKDEFSSEENNTTIKFPYKEAVGSLLYLSKRTRPDIEFAVNKMSRVSSPVKNDVLQLKRIFKYLQGSKHLGINYGKEEDERLVAYCDADFAGDNETRRSTSGFVVFYGGGPVSWGTKKQPVVALSTAEAEYIAASECVKELVFLKNVLEEVNSDSVKAVLKIDNQSALKMIKNGCEKRSKHIDVRFKFINEKVNENNIELLYCPTEQQVADLFTKPLNTNKFV